MERTSLVVLIVTLLIVLAYLSGYMYGKLEEFAHQPIVKELSVDEVFQMASKTRGRIVLPRGTKDLVIIPRKDGGVTLRYERK